MRYEVARTLIKTGDILSFSGNHIYSKIIKAWGGIENRIWTGKYKPDHITHVGVALWLEIFGKDRLCIIESHALKGVQVNPLSEVLEYDYWKCGGQAYWQILSNVDGKQVAANALQYWKRPYAPWYQFIISGLKLSQIIRSRLGYPIDIDIKSFHCSELVSTALQEAGYNVTDVPATITPEEVSSFPCLGSRTLLEP